MSDSTDQKSTVMMTFSSSLPTLKLNNGQNLKLDIGRESILSSTKQAPIQADTATNKCPTKLRQETVVNKSQEIRVLKITGKYSKQKTVLIHTAAKTTPKHD